MIGLCLKYEQVNYGSKLQALATLRLMEEIGLDCKVIHYGKGGLWFKIKSLPRIFNSTFRQDKIEAWSRQRAYKKHPELLPLINQRSQIFKRYDSQYFDKYEIKGKYYSDIKDIASQCDAVVTCSDQLWSPAGLGTNFYNLMFVPDDILKISFASSFGVSSIPWYQRKATARYLNRIDYISCRENRGAEIVKELTGRDVPVLMDPVFAYDMMQWENIVPYQRTYDEPYVFCYFLGNNPEQRKAVKQFANSKHLKIVCLKFLDQYVDSDNDFGDIAPFDVDPNKFLNILRNAKYVFTDSFHGCAFSIIMHKNFVIFNRYASNSSSSKNSRIDTVCENLGLNSRRATGGSNLNDIVDKTIDWSIVDEKSVFYAEKMREYLSNALKGVNV